MPDTPLTRIADLLLGTEPKQRLRIARSLTAASVYVVCMLLQAYACVAGFMHWRDMIELSVLIVLNILFWYTMLRTGLNNRFADPALTLPQILSALTVNAIGYGITGPIHASTMMIIPMVLVFGIFNMKAREAKIAGAYTVVLMGMMIAYKCTTEPELYPVKLEIAHFGLILAIVPTISSLAAQLANLRSRLQRQKEDLSEALERIQILATRDELTGLYNRRHMMDTLVQHQKRLLRTGHHRFCLAIIDIDFFKRINDAHGHQVGDEVLRNFGQAALSMLRETDVLARWGGEEFMVLLNDTHTQQANVGLERIRARLASTCVVASMPDLRVTFSAGLTNFEISESVHACIERADQALYSAKAGGRNCTHMADFVPTSTTKQAQAVA